MVLIPINQKPIIDDDEWLLVLTKLSHIWDAQSGFICFQVVIY